MLISWFLLVIIFISTLAMILDSWPGLNSEGEFVAGSVGNVCTDGAVSVLRFLHPLQHSNPTVGPSGACATCSCDGLSCFYACIS